jgi:hypothetical protein
MSQLECPSCRLKISALGAPRNCPRCLVRKGERVELLAAPLPAPEPRKPAPSVDPQADELPTGHE